MREDTYTKVSTIQHFMMHVKTLQLMICKSSGAWNFECFSRSKLITTTPLEAHHFPILYSFLTEMLSEHWERFIMLYVENGCLLVKRNSAHVRSTSVLK